MKADNGHIYSVQVIAKASRDEVELAGEGVLRVKVTAPPVDGKANEAVIRLLAAYFGISRSGVKILRGHSGSRKQVSVQRPTD